MALKRKVNILMVFKVIGWLLIIESVFMLVPMITSIVYSEPDYIAFLIGILSSVLFGSFLTFGLHPTDTSMGKRDGFLLTALVWIMFSFFGMIPLMLCSTPMSFTDAFFESMSGFTTTSCTSMSSIEQLSKGVIMWRCLMQWIGGMGIILFTLAVLPMLNHSGGMQMFNAEVTGITHDKIRPRISQTAKSLWGVYICLTIAITAFLWLGPMNLFESICYSFSTISTGGFGTSDGDISTWNSVYVKIVLIMGMFMGGISFGLLYKAVRGEIKLLWGNDVFRCYCFIIISFLVLFVVAIFFRGNIEESILSLFIDPLFQIVSTISSTGFMVDDFSGWGVFCLSLLFVLMFIGGCAGSTSGGAKIDRVLLLFKNIKNEIYRSLHPNAVMSVRINGRVAHSELVAKVVAFLCLYVILVVVGGILLTALGVPLVDSFFASFSCICNTGYSPDITGYGGTFSQIPGLGKWLLALLMLIGRLEIFTVLVIFARGFWRR